MSIEAKATLLQQLQERLSTKIVAADMPVVLAAIADQLAYYDVAYTEGTEQQADDLLDAYVSAMQIQGRSEKTIERYKYIIQRMMAKVRTSTRTITVFHLRQYLAQEKARGISESTLEGIRQIFSAYFNWLQCEGLITTNPTANLGAIKCPQKIKVTYSDIEIEKLKYCCSSARDRAIIAFLMSTGCRISEMTQLNRDDIDFANLECKVLGKGNKERTVYLDSVTGMLLLAYLRSRTDEYKALFIGKGSDRISPHGVRNMLNRLAKSAGVDHVHPHKFRRTLATNLIHRGMPVQEVASILGHDKLDTTMQYVVLDKTDLKNSYRKYA